MPSAASNNTKVVVALLAAVLVAGAAVMFLRSEPAATPDVEPAGYTGPGRYVVIDGWSWATTDAADMTATADESDVPIEFRPIDAATLQHLLAASPGTVTQLVARLLTDDPDLTCSAEGCSSADGPLSAEQLLDPASSSELLADAGVEALGYVAVLDPDTVHQLSVPGAVSPASVLPAEDPATLAGEVRITERGPEGTYPPADPDNPVWAATPIGVAWGRVFELSASHLNNSDAGPPVAFGIPFFDSPSPGSTELDPAPFSEGLSVADDRLAALSGSQLTTWSSPSRNCGPGVVCARTADGADITSTQSAELVCNETRFQDGVQRYQLTRVARSLTSSTDSNLDASRVELWSGSQLVAVAPSADDASMGFIAVRDGDC
jgi:hypothetical protein